MIWLTLGAVFLLSGLLAFPRVQFLSGGVLINLGYRLQDRLHAFDLVHHEGLTPQQVWLEVKRQNEAAADVRRAFPRSVEHPLVALLVCMDSRLDTSELVGDTRRYYYVVRTAGSVLGPPEQEMLELAVQNGVRVLVLTTHSDCAAERAARDPEKRLRFPALVSLLDERKKRIQEFRERPLIRDALARGKLEIKYARVDTDTDRLVEQHP
jgi:carbonic anhydrase